MEYPPVGYAGAVHWMLDIQGWVLCDRCNRSY